MTLPAYMRAFVLFLSLGTLIGPREMAANFSFGASLWLSKEG
jgi:hypothetical protein